MKAESCAAHRFATLGCLECCARLVLSPRPSRDHAAGMLEAIRRFLARNPSTDFTVADVSRRARELGEST